MIPSSHDPYQTSLPDFLSHLQKPKNTKRGRCQTGAWRRTSNLFSAVWGISCLHRCAKFGPPQLGTPKFGKFWNHFGEYLLASTSIYQHPLILASSNGIFTEPIVQASEPAATVAPTAPAGAPKAGRWTKKHGKNGEIPQWNLQKSHGTIHEWYMRNDDFFFPGFPCWWRVLGQKSNEIHTAPMETSKKSGWWCWSTVDAAVGILNSWPNCQCQRSGSFFAVTCWIHFLRAIKGSRNHEGHEEIQLPF